MACVWIAPEPVLFLNVGDDILLFSVDPADQCHKKQLPWLEDIHEHDSTCRMALRNVLPVQRLRSIGALTGRPVTW